VRLAASTLFIIGIVLSNQVHAKDFSIQPLTRIDCDKAEMAWDENANICIAGSAGSRQPLTRLGCEMAGMAWNDNANVCGTALAAEALPKADAANAGFKSPTTDASSQPLTKNQCEKAHMRWNDSANVCGENSGTQAAAKTTGPVPSSIVVNIDKTKQQMTVFLDGVERYNWPVSTGKSGYSTPSGTFTAMSMNEVWYSKEWDNAPMPHAIFFMKDGHAIHGSYEVKTLGKPVSHGCVRISPQNAATLYDLVAKTGLKNTQVVLAGDAPGGEARVASKSRSGPRYSQNTHRSYKPKFDYYAESFPQPERRGGFFRRLFGGYKAP
jgi:lipoprotein-anchoring transpeptidase ErfK/SrfK